MGSSESRPVPPLKPVPEGKTRICIAGFTVSTWTGLARRLAGMITSKHGDKFETWFYFASSNEYYAFLKEKFDPIPFPPHLKGHSSSPFVWLERGPNNEIELLGGCTEFKKWIGNNPDFAADADILSVARGSWKVSDTFHDGKGAPQSTADISKP